MGGRPPHVDALLARITRYAYARDRQHDRQSRTIDLTDDDALHLIDYIEELEHRP